MELIKYMEWPCQTQLDRKARRKDPVQLGKKNDIYVANLCLLNYITPILFSSCFYYSKLFGKWVNDKWTTKESITL